MIDVVELKKVVEIGFKRGQLSISGMIDVVELKKVVEIGFKRGQLSISDRQLPPVMAKQPTNTDGYLFCPICHQPIGHGVRHAAFVQPDEPA